MSKNDLLYASLIMVPLFHSVPALAQSEPAPAGAAAEVKSSAEEPGAYDVMQDIVVTAQKRAENVQDVPIAITAFSGESLVERQVSDVSAIGNITPNVNLDAGTPFSGSTSVLGAFIRGIGQNDFAINVDPGVGVYLDGIYLARTVGANLELPDVERVEILKGPQGTLFGRNTIGGAISVVTRDPGDEFAVNGSVTTGRFHRFDVDGTVDIPISDTLRGMVTFSVKNRDGYAKRIPYTQSTPFVTDPSTAFDQVGYGSSDDEGGENQRTGRIKLKWEPSPSFSATFAGDYTRVNQSALPTSVFAVRALPGALAGLAGNNIPGTALDVVTHTSGFNFAGLYNFCIGATGAEIAARNAQNLCGPRGTPLNPAFRQPALASANVDGNPFNNLLPFDSRWVTANPDETYATGPSFSKLTSWGLSSLINFEVSDDITLRSITGYRKLEYGAGLDADNSPIAYLHVTQASEQEQFSQEVQALGSLLNNSLKFVLGAYYFKEKANSADKATIGAGFLQIDGPIELETENYAFFGQLDWRPIELIGFTVGGRYTHESKQFEGFQSDTNGFAYKLFNCTDYLGAVVPCRTILGFPDPNNPLRLYPPGVQHKSFNNFSPKFGVQLHPNNDIMAYASYSVGYKTGGWSARLEGALPTAPDFDDEKAKTWEAGLKAELFNRRVRANLAVFTTTYEDMQLLFQAGTSPLIRNAGTARIKGFELEATVAPVERFSITGSVGYLDARFTSILAGAQFPPNPDQAGLVVGAELPKVPRWKFNIAPRLELPLGNAGALVVLADYTHVSTLWNDSQRTYLLRRPAVDILNASVTYKAPDGRWKVTLGGTNLTGDRYVVNGLGQLAGGLIYGSYNRPREWYLKFGFNF